MAASDAYREPGYVAFRLGGGCTKVVLERFIGVGRVNGGVEWDVPTEDIPPHLRTIGSRVLLIGKFARPDCIATGEEVRRLLQEARRKCRIDEVGDSEFPPPNRHGF